VRAFVQFILVVELLFTKWSNMPERVEDDEEDKGVTKEVEKEEVQDDA